ncbi:Resolvase helix-turn-helix domain protein [Delftia acidovorans SPH-1]|uniref:Resolvase helix-turn-helix domain protein n=1 Tax=Delftia acidovorans (strain DSM 14801 / SPH-1) TaxID=398578 RepID=A9C3K4_DELAS|nr:MULTISPECIES: helix-turn-helix domain-containing protein [Delftia]MBA4004195.1 resolvase [Delftia sp.]OLE94723.1 MAG: resolvase [Delftia sp. 13_1_40CM_3_66_6]ABX37315.1 Resolvase helix-turn-helix domain protein [Delftia acidovorans SPH-1]OLE07843.1 MAG: resolvase [Delftia sp. 13_1_20CM_4_67_18]QPS73451.1 helix-turn-helix domain-containing protein [Delftia acidovorans]
MTSKTNTTLPLMQPDAAKSPATPEADFAPDLVDRMFDYLVELLPELRGSPAIVERVQQQLRSEFAGQDAYIPARSSVGKAEERRQVLRLWNGRNAKAVARTLGISRATVYRYLEASRLNPSQVSGK